MFRSILFFVSAGAFFFLSFGCVSPKYDLQNNPLGFQQIISDAGEKVFPAVVYIRAVADQLESGRNQGNIVAGSGVLISADGEILTNCHVVNKAQRIRCLLNDGRAFPAKLIGMDKDLDIALLRLELPKGVSLSNFAELEQKHSPAEGDFVMAMGAPWGLNRSVTIGIISCASRYLPGFDYSLWYQTDASISPGNSGGPLINTRGKIIGINTLGMLFGGPIAFSVPAPTILDALPRLRTYGKVNWAWFGFQLQPLRDFERNIYFNGSTGVIVSGTEAGSPARRAGFLPDDRITAVDGVAVTVLVPEDLPGFRRGLGLRPFGKEVIFTVVRNGKTLNIPAAPLPKGKVEGDEISCPRWGLTAKTINRFDTPDLYYYRNSGVYLYGTVPFGNAQQAGLIRNDILLSINGKNISSLEELKQLYKKMLDNVQTEPKAVFLVLRNGQTRQFVIDFAGDNDL